MREQKGIVSIFRGMPGWASFQSPELVSVIRLGEGQSVREIINPEAEKVKRESKRKAG